MEFEWDHSKEVENLEKHGVDFSGVGFAWSDPHRVILRHPGLTAHEVRYQFVGFDGYGILTVRFTIRGGRIRIIGAGYWRKQRRIYEKQKQKNQLRRRAPG